MTNGQKIQPMALLAGLGVATGILYFAHRRHQKCTVFPEIYSETGPIHLKPDADIEVREYVSIKLEDARAAGIDIDTARLTKMAAQYIAPDCDWDDMQSPNAQQIYASISTIVHHLKAQEQIENG
jgi:hypothetical protein